MLDHATIADLRGRFRWTPNAPPGCSASLLNQERNATNAETEDALLVAVRDYRALHLATLDMLARCPTCRCGAVATVVDHAAKRDSCDACHTGNATDRPWAGLARAMTDVTTLPG